MNEPLSEEVIFLKQIKKIEIYPNGTRFNFLSYSNHLQLLQARPEGDWLEEGVSLMFLQGLEAGDVPLAQKPVEREVGRTVCAAAAVLTAIEMGGEYTSHLLKASSAAPTPSSGVHVCSCFEVGIYRMDISASHSYLSPFCVAQCYLQM